LFISWFLGIEPRALCKPGKCSTTDLHSQHRQALSFLQLFCYCVCEHKIRKQAHIEDVSSPLVEAYVADKGSSDFKGSPSLGGSTDAECGNLVQMLDITKETLAKFLSHSVSWLFLLPDGRGGKKIPRINFWVS
jgi:hypothetical protein